MKAIVAVDKKWGIGKNNTLLYHIAEDMRFFRQQTMGKTVVMGRKTLESMPGGKPLKGRNNIVLGHLEPQEGVTVVNDVDALLKTLSGLNPEDVFVIGGQSVYEQLLPYCESVLVTKIFADREADAFFPNLDLSDGFELVQAGEPISCECGIDVTFNVYKNKNLKTLD